MIKGKYVYFYFFSFSMYVVQKMQNAESKFKKLYLIDQAFGIYPHTAKFHAIVQ